MTNVSRVKRRGDIPQDLLSDEDFERLSILIKDYSGINLPGGKKAMLEGRLRRRLRALTFPSFAVYCDYLFGTEAVHDELVHLIDAVTTNKTDFFREIAHFDFVEHEILPAWTQARCTHIKAWSAAASSGAEAYTLAMVCAEHHRLHGGPDFTIFCTDVCKDVLVQARVGTYPNTMVAPVPRALRDRYLRRAKNPTSDLVRITPDLRRRLYFGRLNLMDDQYPLDRNMDMLFCRNILIYFDKATQEKVLSKLCGHIRTSGYLFLGHSETVFGTNLPIRKINHNIFQKI